MSEPDPTLSKEEPGLTLTLNNMGYMFDDMTKIGEEFVSFSSTCPLPVLDIGAAYGVATIAALQQGATVVANDLDGRHLEILKENTPSSLHHRLKLYPGRFPSGMNFDEDSFGAILMSNFLHFVPEDEIVEGLRKSYKWLVKGGKVFVIVGSPFVKMAETFLPVYEERVRKGYPWPAFVEDTQKYLGPRAKVMQPFMNFFDLNSLKHAFIEAGFSIEWADYLPRKDWPQDMQLDGREQVGLIGIKG